jgi:hypothetical protein
MALGSTKPSREMSTRNLPKGKGRAVPQLKRLVAGFPPRRPGFDPGSGQVGFVVDKVALGRVSSEYFGFPCQSSVGLQPPLSELKKMVKGDRLTTSPVSVSRLSRPAVANLIHLEGQI